MEKEQLLELIERLKGVKLQSHHKGYIGNLRLELNWSKLGLMPHAQCSITIVDSVQAKSIRESRMDANSFFAHLRRDDLIKLRSQIDDVLKILDEAETEFGTPEELEQLREYVSQVWEMSK